MLQNCSLLSFIRTLIKQYISSCEHTLTGVARNTGGGGGIKIIYYTKHKQYPNSLITIIILRVSIYFEKYSMIPDPSTWLK